ncbi:MAG: ATP-binding cassette domain-containing protein [Deltaproteobacteria bacterium]|nr:ATP-binding cassette domain-containing protein [Deltaproteobacteria bacterium]
MSEIAIHVENLSKLYRIGARQRHRTLREALMDAFATPFRGARSKLQSANGQAADGEDNTFWALKGLSFEIKRGEVVGVIGRNGAGKSTLLKILSRITEPTTGFADIRGRVASLLEVGTGFHGELSGRENIYLNGAILGMRRMEIARKFDEIVAFAEIEKFIDTPVKHYSTGMYLRLAFAVAAHLEPEILIVDEVLAVGDANFQKKCLNKVEEVGMHGRTVLFVSHNMPSIIRLCQRVVLLDQGTIVEDGPSHKTVSAYLKSGSGTTASRKWPLEKAPGGDVVRLRAVQARTQDGQVSEVMDIRQPIAIEMEYDVLRAGLVLSPWYEFFNEEGVEIFPAVDQDLDWRRRPRPVGRYVSTAWIPGNLLSEGTLFVNVGVASMEPTVTKQVYERDVIAFQVSDTMEGDSARGDWGDSWGGAVRPLLKWETQYSPRQMGSGWK